MKASLAVSDEAQPWAGVRFADDEYRRRYERLQAELASSGIDVALLSDERTVWYLTGFGDATLPASASRVRPRIVLAPASGPPTLFVQQCQHIVAQEMSWFDDVRAYPGLGAPIGDLVSELGLLGAAKLGLELSGELKPSMNVAEFDALRRQLPAIAVRDAAQPVWAVRMIKSPFELDRIRSACAITDRVYAEVFAQLAHGVTEREVARMIDAALRAGGGDDAWSVVAAGESQYDRVDGVPRDLAIPDRTMVFVDCGANVGGYWADFSRSGVFGAPSPRQERLQRAILEVTAIGVAAIRPGRTTGDVAHEIASAMTERGLTFGSQSGRWGHGLGLIVTEPPHVADDDETVIEPGMVLTIEPNVIDWCGMFHCEENVVVTETGTEKLSHFPVELAELGADGARHGA